MSELGVQLFAFCGCTREPALLPLFGLQCWLYEFVTKIIKTAGNIYRWCCVYAAVPLAGAISDMLPSAPGRVNERNQIFVSSDDTMEARNATLGHTFMSH